MKWRIWSSYLLHLKLYMIDLLCVVIASLYMRKYIRSPGYGGYRDSWSLSSGRFLLIDKLKEEYDIT